MTIAHAPAREFTPPNSPDAERQIIGAVLRGDTSPKQLSLTPDDFYQLRHQHIWRAMLVDATPDMFSIREWLREHGLLDKIADDDGGDGDEYLLQLRDDQSFGFTINAQRVAESLRMLSQRRRIIKSAQTIARLALDSDTAHADMMSGIERAFVDAVTGNAISRTVHVRDVVNRAFEQIERLHTQTESAIGMPTGFVDVDRLLRGGAKDGELVIVAARPSVGKSSLLMSIVLNSSVECRRPATPKRGAIYTLEMSDESLVVRLQAAMSGIDSARLSVADLRDDEWGALTQTMMRLSDAPVWMNDAPMSISDIAADARRMKAVHQIDYLMIDFLGLVQSSGRTDYERASAVALGAQTIAKELRIPVFLACQLSREADGVRPELSHLRDSGRIEEAGDVVMMLYRDEQHNPNTEYKNIGEIIIRKNRNGPTGTAMLFFDKRLTVFRNLRKERLEL